MNVFVVIAKMAATMLLRQSPVNRLFYFPLSVLRNGLAMKSTSPESGPPSADDIEQILQQRVEDMPVLDMSNPYLKENKVCVLCKYKVELDYKNTKLLSQFVSPFTGRVYSKSITGLCEKQYKRVGSCIERAQRFGFMPYVHKDLAYLKDPPLFVSATSPRRRR